MAGKRKHGRVRAHSAASNSSQDVIEISDSDAERQDAVPSKRAFAESEEGSLKKQRALKSPPQADTVMAKRARPEGEEDLPRKRPRNRVPHDRNSNNAQTSVVTPTMNDGSPQVPGAPRIPRIGTHPDPQTPPSTFPEASSADHVLDTTQTGSDDSIDYFEGDDTDEYALMLAMDAFDNARAQKPPARAHVRLAAGKIFFTK